MSAESVPISAARFASALNDLPVSALHAKVQEIRNSIAHLELSNTELEKYVREEDDKDCYEALMENKEVIKRMEERIELVKREIVEVRGLPFEPEKANTTAGTGQNGGDGSSPTTRASGEQNGTSEEPGEEGVFL
ncbi:hypothetical protein BU24DRAFT_109332 [Aaosphaeria arxii CBS 175.79]|uniref:Uncharacterized protein n=1 Tax=Aaosphaeria arxii CBS 175.79 TaxID=1450172 RepID=A0A6A5Y0A0_9PLEO|nr:uncharacterized protein BU24DRAFT_109332 [Aaosphaeria arxii CBS 175.79]KAF2018958.1 hypothetical protein BU24DRAFT_109332 [Aaosphaeria arxii CBS 175.79]